MPPISAVTARGKYRVSHRGVVSLCVPKYYWLYHDGEMVLWMFDLTSLNTREGQGAWSVTCPMNGRSFRELLCQQAQWTLANGSRQG